MLKLYLLSEDTPSLNLNFIKLALSMMEVEYYEIVLQGNQNTKDGKDGEKIQTLASKSFASSSKFPLLESDDGSIILSEALSIFKWLSRNKYAGFYDHPMIDQWIDILTSRIYP
jgi:hypothetical protein